MNRVRLSELISAYAIKRLTGHEVDPKVSNGHEFQGVNGLRAVLGYDRLTEVPCTFVWLPGDDSNAKEPVEAKVTWYDSREFDPGRSAEWRLYYDADAGNLVQSVAREGDLFVLAKFNDGNLVVFIVASGSTYERQILTLLGASDGELKFQVGSIDSERQIGLAEEMILAFLGIEAPEPDIRGAEDLVERLFYDYGGEFPSTEIFSKRAMERFEGPSPTDDPDAYLVGIMEWESALFRLFEERLVAVRLEQGFEKIGGGYDVESFISFSRSIGNRRFSRAGHAFEHHVKAVLEWHGVAHGWHVRTEGKRTPDFVFPSASKYHDSAFPAEKLRMLGVKTSCKDRWRQVINEAARIANKHLLTLEPGISEDQTNEMKEERVLLVVPSPIHTTYTSSQKPLLLSFGEFLSEVKALQSHG